MGKEIDLTYDISISYFRSQELIHKFTNSLAGVYIYIYSRYRSDAVNVQIPQCFVYKFNLGTQLEVPIKRHWMLFFTNLHFKLPFMV